MNKQKSNVFSLVRHLSEEWISGNDRPETASGDDGPEATRPEMTAVRISSKGSGERLLSFPLASPSGPLYVERMFCLLLCINQSIHCLHLYRSLYSNSILRVATWSPARPAAASKPSANASANVGKRPSLSFGITLSTNMHI